MSDFNFDISSAIAGISKGTHVTLPVEKDGIVVGAEVVDKRLTPRYKLETPWVRAQLIMNLAARSMTVAQLAEQFRVSEAGIRAFMARHEGDIELARQQSFNAIKATACQYGLWVVEKLNRIAVYQDDIERLQAIDNPSVAEVRLKHSALHAVAEEMGQLPTKVQMEVQGQVAHYVLEVAADEDV